MRSKTLLVSNIFATIYSIVLLCWIGGGIIATGGIDYINLCAQSFSALANISSDASNTITIIYTVFVLLISHICLFPLGAFFGWISLLTKRSGLAKFSATLYLIGTLCFPVYIIFALPIVILGYVGGSKQKKINTEIKNNQC